MDKYRFFYRIDGFDLVPGNKTAGFCFSVLTQALCDLIQIQVPAVEIERLMSGIHRRIERVGGSVREAGQQAQIMFVEGTACPRAFIADPLFGGSLGADPEAFGRLQRPDRLDWIGPEVEYKPHNCDTQDQAIILVVLVQAWAEYARAKLRHLEAA